MSSTIQVENKWLKAGFTQIPNVVLRDGELSQGAKLTYGLLLSYAWQKGECFPGKTRLSKDLAVSVRTITTYLQELKKVGYVDWKRRGQGRTNLYVLKDLMGTYLPIKEDDGKIAAPQDKQPVADKEYSVEEDKEYISLEDRVSNELERREIEHRKLPGGTPMKPLSRQMWDAIVEGLHLKLTNRGAMNQSIKKLTTAGYTPQNIRDYAAWELQNPFWAENGRAPTLATLMKNIDGWVLQGRPGSKRKVEVEYEMSGEQMTRRATACWLFDGKEVCTLTLDEENRHPYCVMCPKWEKEGV